MTLPNSHLLIDNWRVRRWILWTPCALKRHPWEFEIDAGIIGMVRKCSCGRRTWRKGYVGWTTN